MVQQRLRSGDADQLAAALSGMSVGRQPPVWRELHQAQPSFLFVAGSNDGKFVDLGQKLLACTNFIPPQQAAHAAEPDAYLSSEEQPDVPLQQQASSGIFMSGTADDDDFEKAAFVKVLGCGHAVHIERPEALVRILGQAVS